MTELKDEHLEVISKNKSRKYEIDNFYHFEKTVYLVRDVINGMGWIRGIVIPRGYGMRWGWVPRGCPRNFREISEKSREISEDFREFQRNFNGK